MTESTLWLIVTGFFVSLEMLSRSAYLLMLAFGALCAALLAWVGASQGVQLMAAAAIGGLAVAAWHFHLLKRGPLLHSTGFDPEFPDVEIGTQVDVQKWETDGTCKVRHEGMVCVGRHFGPHLPSLGLHRVISTDGSFLVLELI